MLVCNTEAYGLQTAVQGYFRSSMSRSYKFNNPLGTYFITFATVG